MHTFLATTQSARVSLAHCSCVAQLFSGAFGACSHPEYTTRAQCAAAAGSLQQSEAATLPLALAARPAIDTIVVDTRVVERRALAELTRARLREGPIWTDSAAVPNRTGASSGARGAELAFEPAPGWDAAERPRQQKRQEQRRQRLRRRLKGGGGGGGDELDGEIRWRNPSFGSFDDFFSSMTLLYVMSTLDDWDQESHRDGGAADGASGGRARVHLQDEGSAHCSASPRLFSKPVTPRHDRSQSR